MRGRAAFGAGSIVLSGVLWLMLPAVPLLPVSSWWRGAVAMAVLIVAEVAFWGGCALAGPDALRRMKAWFGVRRRAG